MKHLRLAAGITAGVLCFGLLAGCGTSHMSESESLPESVDSGWEQLNTATPTPKTDTVMPELDQKDKNLDGGTDVTDDYKTALWALGMKLTALTSMNSSPTRTW